MLICCLLVDNLFLDIVIVGCLSAFDSFESHREDCTGREINIVMGIATAALIKSARIFSGIQPTGIPHLGNYFGAISQWIRYAEMKEPREIKVEEENNISTFHCDVPIYCIVDVHAYTSHTANYGKQFYDKILSTTASLLALGLDPNNCILTRQSDLLEHNFLQNVFSNFVSTGRLSRMTQYKEKAATGAKESNLHGLISYPILQAADILLYRANLIPVGEDQIQHIELTRDIGKKFNVITDSQLFPKPVALLNDSVHGRRVRSLRDPTKKMSKSDPQTRSFIEVIDEPEVILKKIKMAITDGESSVYYDAERRPGVANLMRIYHLATNQSLDQITEQCRGIDTGQFKLKLADILIDKLKPVREEYKRIRNDQAYLEQVLKSGHDKAKPMAMETVSQVKHLLGSRRLD